MTPETDLPGVTSDNIPADSAKAAPEAASAPARGGLPAGLLSRLPGSISDFEELRRRNRIYVDKTAYIYEIAVFNGPFILTRPANFGKTLLLSTLASLFSHGMEHFKGLSIDGHWRDTGDYQVLTLDFAARFDSLKNLDAAVCAAIEDFAAKNGVDLASHGNGLHVPLTHRGPELIGNLLENSKKQTVLLIDNFDAPLSVPGFGSEEVRAVSHYLTEFFTIVNNSIAHLRFLLVAGVMPVPLSDMFDVFRNYINLTLDSENAALLGFTPEETEKFMAPELNKAAEALGLPRKELLRLITRYYGGYRMTIDSPAEVINPRSLIRFLSRPEEGFQNYWPESGLSYASLAAGWLRSLSDDILGNILEVLSGPYSLKESYGFIGTPPGSALYHAGYLAVRTIKNELGRRRAVLTPPNLNATATLLNIYFTLVSENPVSEADIADIASGVRDGLMGGYPEALTAALNRGLSQLSFGRESPFDKVSALRDILYAILVLAGLEAERLPESGESADLTAAYLKDGKVSRVLITAVPARSGDNPQELIAKAGERLDKTAFSEESWPFPQDRETAGPGAKLVLIVSPQEKRITHAKLL
ncbi:AAA family ATPase [Succinimonas sp.]|uniref:AAA family ATPase n=1 Tax=Succinimonas sp. TaxID=1936151 RepID=UPI0038679A04